MRLSEWEVNPSTVTLWFRHNDFDFTVSMTHDQFANMAFTVESAMSDLDKYRKTGELSHGTNYGDRGDN